MARFSISLVSALLVVALWVYTSNSIPVEQLIIAFIFYVGGCLLGMTLERTFFHTDDN